MIISTVQVDCSRIYLKYSIPSNEFDPLFHLIIKVLKSLVFLKSGPDPFSYFPWSRVLKSPRILQEVLSGQIIISQDNVEF